MNKLTPLIHARIEAGYMTQTAFAKAAGISVWTVNMLENMHRIHRPMKDETVDKMAKALNLPSDVIFSWLENS